MDIYIFRYLVIVYFLLFICIVSLKRGIDNGDDRIIKITEIFSNESLEVISYVEIPSI